MAGPAEIRLGFSVGRWCLWQSWEAPAGECWPGGERLPCGGGGADVGFLPMMQRRRLSPLARAAIAVAWRCRDGRDGLPAVFFSSHGESRHYFEMLDGLAGGQDISPSRFSLSVHNAIAGLFSQLDGGASPYVALAGGPEGPFSAFLEAHGLLSEGVGEVLAVWCEQALPAAYRPYAASPPGTWALAMRLGRAGGAGPQLSLARAPAAHAPIPADPCAGLGRAILAGLRQSECRAGGAVWRWSLDHA